MTQEQIKQELIGEALKSKDRIEVDGTHLDNVSALCLQYYRKGAEDTIPMVLPIVKETIDKLVDNDVDIKKLTWEQLLPQA